MKPRWFAVLACVLLLASMSMAIEDLGKDRTYRRPMKDDGSSSGLGDSTITCSIVYYHSCSSSSCISSTAAGSCCGDCRKSDGMHSPCQVCVAN